MRASLDTRLLDAGQLTYRLADDQNLFSQLDLSIQSGRKIGLVGTNGAGKSTLLRLLARILPPSSGEVRWSQSLEDGGLGYLAQQEDPGALGLTILDLLGLARTRHALARIEAGDTAPELYEELEHAGWDFEDRARESLARLGLGHLTLDREIRALSGGEKIRIRLAALALARPKLCLLDEPTNHLDGSARSQVLEWIRSWPEALLVVSHDRALLGQLDEIWELSPARGLKVYGGNFDFYQACRQAERAKAEHEAEAARRETRKKKRELQESLERQQKRQAQGKRAGVKSGLPKIMRGALKRQAELTLAKNQRIHEDRLEQAKSQLAEAQTRLDPSAQIRIDLPDTGVHPRKSVLELTGINFRFAPSGAELWPEPKSFSIQGPARIGIVGDNGVGKSLLLKAIAGMEQPGILVEGSRSVHVAFAFLDQEVAILDPGRSLLENFARFTPHLATHERRVRLGRFLFEQERVHQQVATLSAGERLRAALACVLHKDPAPQLLLLDEPTNHLDLFSLEALEAALQSFKGALLVVSHREDFLSAIRIEETWEIRRSRRLLDAGP